MTTRLLSSMAAAACATALLGAGPGFGVTAANAQTAAADTGLTPQTIVVTQRPLRTFRGEAVRIGRYAESEKSIGVVRPLREVPVADQRQSFFYGHRYDRSDRGAARGRVILDAYRAPYPRYEKSIGVVRAYRTFDPVERHAPRTLTNPHARPATSEDAVNLRPQTVGPVFSPDEASAVIAVRSDRAWDDAPATDDPWALLDRGRYRDARDRFEQSAPDESNDVEWQTGRALARTLSGDLAGGAALMPASPAVPEDTRWSDSTRQRIELTRAVSVRRRPGDPGGVATPP